MAGGSDPFSVFDQLTAARAAMDVNDDGIKLEAGVDPIRVQREAKRREEPGQLRARERSRGRKHNGVERMFH
jgi:hypothetical protein